MLRGLQIRITGEELSRRIAERIDVKAAEVAALDERIRRRDGDLPFDVRVEDGLSTLAELKTEREQRADRLRELTLMRDSIVPDELYLLSKADLRLAGLVACEADDAAADGQRREVVLPPQGIVDGLKVTVEGAELQDLLDKRIETHRQRAESWKREQARPPETDSVDNPLLPEHICENEAQRHEWRADVLHFIRDRLDPAETYRLGEDDFAFGELLPERPAWLDNEED